MANGNGNGNGNGGPSPIVLFIGIFAWFLLGWVLPIVRLRDEKTTANMKTVWSGWLIIAGMGPIVYGAYTTYKKQGNANSNTTGGNKPPNTSNGAVPTQPSAAAGGGQELVPAPA